MHKTQMQNTEIEVDGKRFFVLDRFPAISALLPEDIERTDGNKCQWANNYCENLQRTSAHAYTITIINSSYSRTIILIN